MRKRLLTGDRPTGRLHLGHYVGSLKNRVKLQDEYETYLLVADLHMLTTKPDKESIAQVFENARGMVLDHLAAGIDPSKVTFYLQSAVQEVFELNLIFEMLVTVNRLSRLPSLKDMARAAHITEMPFGLLGYPLLGEPAGAVGYRGWHPPGARGRRPCHDTRRRPLSRGAHERCGGESGDAYVAPGEARIGLGLNHR